MAVAVLLDAPRPRVARSVSVVYADGFSWDRGGNPSTPSESEGDPYRLYSPAAGDAAEYLRSFVFVDPITLTAMLRPLALTSEWFTTTAGNYARTTAAGYELADGSPLPAGDWIENHRFGLAGNVFLESRAYPSAAGVPYPVYTQATWPQNQPFVLTWYVPAGAQLADTALEFGWGDVGSAGSVSGRVTSSGNAEVYKRGDGDAVPVKVAEYSVGAGAEVRRGAATANGQGAPTKKPGDVAGRLFTLYVIPCRRRELLVFSSAGGGFSHVFADLDPAAVGTITPAGRFWWKVPRGKASVQLAPMRFALAGPLRGVMSKLREAPESGATVTQAVQWDTPGYGGATAVTTDLLPAVPDGARTEFAVGAELTGDGTNTPFLYAAFFEIAPRVVSTPAGVTADVSASVTQLSLTVGEEAPGVSGSLLFKRDAERGDPAADPPVPPAAPDLASRSNRPVEVRLGTAAGKPLFFGVNRRPSLVQGATKEGGGSGHRLACELRDLWAQLEAATYEEEGPPFDGTPLTDAVKLLLRHGGIPMAEWDVEASAFGLNAVSAASRGEYSFRPRVGDTVAQWLLRLHRDFAPNWFMGFYPSADGPRFRFRSEAGMGVTPKAEIWGDRDRGAPTEEERAARRACRAFREEVVAPEATRVAVYGFDPRLNRRYVAIKKNTAAENPAAPGGEGWVGEVRPVGLVEPRLTSAEMVIRACDQLFDRLTPALRIGEWRSPLLLDAAGLPLWKGDVVRIRHEGHQRGGDYRILSFAGTLARQGEAPFGRTDFRYVGKRIGDIPEGETDG